MLTKTEEKNEKRKLKILKIQSSTFMTADEKKIQEKFVKIQKRFEGGVAF